MDVREWEAREQELRIAYQKKYGEPKNLDVCQRCPFTRPLHCHNKTKDNFCAYILITGHSRDSRCAVGRNIWSYRPRPKRLMVVPIIPTWSSSDGGRRGEVIGIQ